VEEMMFTNRPAMKKETAPRVNTEQEDFSQLEKEFYYIRDQVQKKLLNKSEGDLALTDSGKVKQMIEAAFNESLDEENLLFNRNIREKNVELGDR
jgi:hypothetical protein